jgi:hypothetical protein
MVRFRKRTIARELGYLLLEVSSKPGVFLSPPASHLVPTLQHIASPFPTMKTSILRLAVCAVVMLFCGYNGRAQTRLTDVARGDNSAPTRRNWSLMETGPDHRKWQSPDAAGRMHSIVEIGSGMNYWDGNRWTASEATFQAVDDGFVVARAQQQIQLAANLNVQNAVTVNMADQSGLVIPSTPVAIGLYDAASGQSLIIAQIQDCAGAMIASNQVVY